MLDQTIKKHTIELVLGLLLITNNTTFSNQDYAIYSAYSTLDISDIKFDQILASEDMILVSESTLTINGLHAMSIMPIIEGHNLISISYSSFNVSHVTYNNSSLELMIILFSTGTIHDISGRNIAPYTDSTISLDYGISIRSTTIHLFDDIHFDSILLSYSQLIVARSSNIYNLNSHDISNTNSVIYTIENSNVYNAEMVSVMNSVSGFEVLNSNLTLSSSNFTKLNSTLSSAVYTKSSNVYISNSIFDTNIARQGAAISLL